MGRSGEPRYRGFVGPPLFYDLIAGLTFSLLFRAGLREDDLLLDVGCGSLRNGRLLIPYLKPERYYGVEPNQWLIDDGLTYELGHEIVEVKRPTFSAIDDFSLGSLDVSFDFVLAQSVLSHTFDELTLQALCGVRDCLAADGLFVATFLESDEARKGSGWSYPDPVPYTWPEMSSYAERAGLITRRLDWPHPRPTLSVPRQRWFVGAIAEPRVEAARTALAAPYPRLQALRQL